MEEHEILLHETRARIHGRLARESLTLSQVARELQLSNSTALWHLQKLLDAGLVAVDRSSSVPRYRQVPRSGATLAEAGLLLNSVPARELVEHLLAHPGQHLGQAAAAIGAPRARYWRVLPLLVRANLVRIVERGRKHTLFVTPLAEKALLAVPGREWRAVKARRTRRPPHKS